MTAARVFARLARLDARHLHALRRRMMRTTQEEALRALAREMATEESERIAELARL